MFDPFDPFLSLLPDSVAAPTASIISTPNLRDSSAAETRQIRRREQSRISSAVFRRKKKEGVERLKEKISILEEEKLLLQQAQQRTQEIIAQLMETRSQIQPLHGVERLALFKQLAECKRTGDFVKSRDVVMAIRASSNRIIDIENAQLHQIISPLILRDLFALGFFNDPNRMRMLERQGMIQMINKIKTKISSLTETQLHVLDRLCYQHSQNLALLYKEREQLANQLSNPFLLSEVTIRMRKSFADEVEEWKWCRNMIIDSILEPPQIMDLILHLSLPFPTEIQIDTVIKFLTECVEINTI